MTRRTRDIEHRGRRMSMTQWADWLGMDRRTLHMRLARGWSIERALSGLNAYNDRRLQRGS